MFYRLALTLMDHTSFAIVPSTMSIPSSSFGPWVPDLNLNKSVEPMPDTAQKYFLTSKSSFSTLSNLFFLHMHSRKQPTCDKILKPYESNEEVVKSISLIISETHFFHCFLLFF